MTIEKVLIANRGEIAVRILKTLNKLNIPGVVIYHAADADSPAVQQADEAVELFGNTPVAAYLDIDAIVAACRSTGANAVHPGFGFLAENAPFAERLAQEGIIFIGPTPDVIELMGNKVSARAFALENEIPVVPSETDLSKAADVGFPLLLKAAAGGGGKGMHIVQSADELEAAIKLTSNEALRSFNDGTLYAERYIEQPRHIEVQILADQHGSVVHLGERECSIQRRFQKVIEEAPSPTLTDDLRESICETAVRIAQAANYQNAGTVEMIVSPDGDFYFLEMNTRLQVEHPVTEMVTGVDLVAEQIRVANGEPLGYDQADIETNGHAIECRIYAEDASDDFAPTTGPILAYLPPQGDGVRVDDGLAAGMRVTPAFDPMLAKLITYGGDREQATERMQAALADYLLLGVQTNIDWLQSVIAHEAFQLAKLHTGFIPQYRDEFQLPELTDSQKRLLAAAVALKERPLSSPEYQPPSMHAEMGGWQN